MIETAKEEAIRRALDGLDYMLRHQIVDAEDANCGRFVYIYDCRNQKAVTYSSSWVTGVCIDTLLIGYRHAGNKEYLEAAGRAAAYLRSLQVVDPENPEMLGVFREVTPQTPFAHTRDALTAAWGLLDYSQQTDDRRCLKSSLKYADWFCRTGNRRGYPFWTVRLDEAPWEPDWYGSFHSGGAFYFFRLWQVTGDRKHLEVMYAILDHYNTHHLEEDGFVNVCVDSQTRKPFEGYKRDERFSVSGWEVMHQYNDDFGALANLAAYKAGGDVAYRDAAGRFLKRMLRAQRADGGFGPESFSVPSAAGAVLMELLAAESLGMSFASDEQKRRIISYINGIQVRDEGHPAYGAFLGVDSNYEVSSEANTRTGAYSIMALFRYAGVADPYYFFG